MFLNGDSVNSLYTSQYAQFSNTTAYQNNSARPTCAYVYANGSLKANISLSLVGGFAFFTSFCVDKSPTPVPVTRVLSGYKNSSVSNVTQITFTSPVPNSIKAGTRFRVYRRDV